MASSAKLRANKAQHKPKNLDSKRSDKIIHRAMGQCIDYFNDRLGNQLKSGGYVLKFSSSISFSQLMKLIHDSNCRHEFDHAFLDRTIKPDGGAIWLHQIENPEYAKIVLISEIKKQGTNKERLMEGRQKQAQGNAIERLGKNLIGIRSALNHEPITPFVCFGWGCDFEEDYDCDSYVMSKVSMMNEYYPLNKTYVFKKDGTSNRNSFAPVSMYFRENEWKQDEMFEILKEVGETSLRYYLF